MFWFGTYKLGLSQKRSLIDRINLYGLHPVTCLTSLTKVEKQKLIDKMVVLCKDLCDRADLLEEIGISKRRIKSVIKEGKEICSLRSES